MAQFARVTAVIAAPLQAIWEVLMDFEHPQRLVPSIERCEINGIGLGSVRIVHVRHLTIHERLESVDVRRHTFSYRILDDGDMPAEGVDSYLATVVLRPVSQSATEIVWSSEGELSGSPKVIEAHFQRLYDTAIENLRKVVVA